MTGYLTPDTLAAWRDYEVANRRAAVEYMARPTSQRLSPRADGLRGCLCCGILTSQFGVCLCCQRLCSDWAEVASSHERMVAIRRADMFPLPDG